MAYWCMFSIPHTPVLLPLGYLIFFVYLLCFFVSYFSVFLYFLIFLLVVVYCAWLRPFYSACCDKIYYFTPQLFLACCGCPSQTIHWSAGCLATTTTLCWPHHTSFLEKISSCFVFLLPVALPSG